MNNEKKFQTGNILSLSFAHLVHDTYSAFLAPILPLLIIKYDISYALAGFLAVAQRLPSLLNPVIGVIADKVSARYFVILSPALTAVAMSLLGIAPHYTAAVILLIVMGIGSTLFHVPAPVMVKKVSGERTGMGMSCFMLGGEFARSLGPVVVLGAVSLWGLEGMWRLIPFALATTVFLHFKLHTIKISDNMPHRKKNRGVWKELVKHTPFFLTITGIIFFRATMHSTLTFYLPTYMTARGESLWLAGMSLAILQFSGAAGTFCCGTLSDHLGRKRTLLIMAVISPSLMWLFMMLGNAYTVPLLIVIGFTLFATNPILLAMVQETGSDRPALMNSIYMGISFLITSVVVMSVGKTADIAGLEITYKIAAAMAFLTIPFILRLPEKKSK